METESFILAVHLGIYPSDKFSEVDQDECRRMSIAALFELAKFWNQLNIMLQLKKNEVHVDLWGKRSKRKRHKAICNFLCMVKSTCYKVNPSINVSILCTSAILLLSPTPVPRCDNVTWQRDSCWARMLGINGYHRQENKRPCKPLLTLLCGL